MKQLRKRLALAWKAFTMPKDGLDECDARLKEMQDYFSIGEEIRMIYIWSDTHREAQNTITSDFLNTETFTFTAKFD